MWWYISILVHYSLISTLSTDLASWYSNFPLIIKHLGENFQWEMKSTRSIHKTYDLPVRKAVIVEVIYTETKRDWVWLTVPCWEVERPRKPAHSLPFILCPLARQWRNSSLPDFSQLRNTRRAENFSGDMKSQAVIAFLKSSLCFQRGT